MDEVRRLLIRNGYTESTPNIFLNSMGEVAIGVDGYSVCNNEGDVMYSKDFNIYWLIGVLTYYGHIEKNYK